MTPAPQQSRPRESWAWIWRDALIRLIPFSIASGFAARFMGGWRAVGIAAPPQGWLAALAVALPVGAVMLLLAILWRRQIAPRYRLPTPADQALQSVFYLIINAPIEEVFWRGVAQTLAIRGLIAVGMAPLPGAIMSIAAISAIFGAYHRLGHYPWRFNIAAMLAGALFGALYAFLPGPSIVVPTIIHGLTTAGYLSWGDSALHWLKLRQVRKKSPVAP